VTGLGKLFRTTAFKLSLAYLAIFAIGAGIVLGRLGWDMKDLLDAQIKQTVTAEIDALAEKYEIGGLRRLIRVIDSRSRQPGSMLYLVTNYQGVPITGNVAILPSRVIGHTGIVETPYERVGDPYGRHYAMVRIFELPSGFRLLVGRDLDEREQLRGAVVHALVTALVYVAVIGMLGGLYVASRVLRRIDGMTATTRTIMAGDLSRRLPISGTGDELDRLAQNLNAMLERISELMSGLKEVSDNIAHDLKTPLTRLRNRAEQALRSARDPLQDGQALESIIEESDGLIRTFNALLMIARAEAGSGREGMDDFDAGAVARDVVELYEPVAEDAGAVLALSAEPGLTVHGNRELVFQSIVNLIENALKYGVKPRRELVLAEGDPAEPDAVEAREDTARVHVSAHRAKGGIEIAVADHGIGIAPADRARACERFVRLEEARSQPGSGLGLSLAAAVAHLHQGKLRLEDNDPGLRAVLALPSAEIAPAARRLLIAPTGSLA
jgi:signal transduction histidine kinase